MLINFFHFHLSLFSLACRFMFSSLPRIIFNTFNCLLPFFGHFFYRFSQFRLNYHNHHLVYFFILDHLDFCFPFISPFPFLLVCLLIPRQTPSIAYYYFYLYSLRYSSVLSCDPDRKFLLFISSSPSSNTNTNTNTFPRFISIPFGMAITCHASLYRSYHVRTSELSHSQVSLSYSAEQEQKQDSIHTPYCLPFLCALVNTENNVCVWNRGVVFLCKAPIKGFSINRWRCYWRACNQYRLVHQEWRLACCVVGDRTRLKKKKVQMPGDCGHDCLIIMCSGAEPTSLAIKRFGVVLSSRTYWPVISTCIEECTAINESGVALRMTSRFPRHIERLVFEVEFSWIFLQLQIRICEVFTNTGMWFDKERRLHYRWWLHIFITYQYMCREV